MWCVFELESDDKLFEKLFGVELNSPKKKKNKKTFCPKQVLIYIYL